MIGTGSSSCSLLESRVCGLISILVGAIIIVAGERTSSFIVSTLQETIADSLLIKSFDSPGFENWRRNTKFGSLPSFKSFYVFNLTNADAFLNGSAALALQEIGPIIYREYFEHFDVSWSNGQIRYKTWSYAVFESSPVPLNSTIITVNVPLLLTLAGLQAKGPAAFLYYSIIKANSHGEADSLFSSLSIENALWGYESSILTTVRSFSKNVNLPTRYGGMTGGNTSSLEAARNASLFDSIWTGESNPSLLQQYSTWQNATTISLCFEPKCPPNGVIQPWLSVEANRVTGSTGRQYPQFVSSNHRLNFFDVYFLRVVGLVFTQSLNLHGVDLLRFSISPTTFLNSTEYPPNRDYYNNGLRGLVNLTAAIANTAFFMSKPRFLGADPLLSSSVTGLGSPNEAGHETFFDIEPFTGAVLNGRMRVQTNVQINSWKFPDGKNVLFSHAPTTIVPLYWFDEGGGIDAATGLQFVNTVYMAQKIAFYSLLFGGVFGSAVVMFGCCVLLRAYRLRSEKSLSFFQFSPFPPLDETDEVSSNEAGQFSYQNQSASPLTRSMLDSSLPKSRSDSLLL